MSGLLKKGKKMSSNYSATEGLKRGGGVESTGGVLDGKRSNRMVCNRDMNYFMRDCQMEWNEK
jgi:hypothetical protein